MDLVALVARVAVGVAFVVAGASKIAAGPAWPVMARDLGAPTAVVPIVPWFEVCVGALLVVGVAEPYPAGAAFVSLLCFTGLIVLRLAQGRRPACACFGAWSARPLGVGHVVRNGALLVAAVLAVLG
ncbi:MAG: hypothetical protein RLZZ01_518 [Actinomycetota bacterium]|jgi:uncharacterized membrane protein YphA (DoxX/SURF4 family)